MSFDDHASFGAAKLADIGGRSLPGADSSADFNNEIFGQSKLEAISGRSLPSPDQGASTLSFNDMGDMDKKGKFNN